MHYECIYPRYTQRLFMKHSFLLIFGLTVAFTASAQTSRSLTNSADVVSSCTINTLQNIAFPSVDVLNAENATAYGTVGVSCTQGNYALRISNGANLLMDASPYSVVSSGSFTDPNRKTYYYYCNRQMKHISGNSYLPYELYSTPAMTSAARNTSASSGYSASRPTGCGTNITFATMRFVSAGQQELNIYAKALINNSLQGGAYTDVISVDAVF